MVLPINIPTASSDDTETYMGVTTGGLLKRFPKPDGSGGGYDTLADAAADTIAASVKALRTSGYADVGDGGHGLYMRLAAAPSDPTNNGYIRSVDRYTSSGSTDSTHGGYWGLVLEGGALQLEQFGGKGDWDGATGTDNLAPMTDAIEYVSFDERNLPTVSDAAGAIIKVGFGKFYFSGPILLDRVVHIQGITSNFGSPGCWRTVFYFAAGSKGIVGRGYQTTGSYRATAFQSWISDLYLLSLGFGGETEAHGIDFNATLFVNRVGIQGFGGNGINIVADINDTPPTNANEWSISHIGIKDCAGHGVYCQGGDVNAGIGYHINVSTNDGWGIYDNSFLGNTWLTCHSDGNTLGAYKTRDDTACASPIIGCYSEAGQPAAEFGLGAIVIGGLHGAGGTGGLGVYGQVIGGHNVAGQAADDPDLELKIRKRTNALFSFGIGGTYYHDLIYSQSSGNYAMEFQDQPGNWAYYITSQDGVVTNGRGAAIAGNRIAFPTGLWLGGAGTPVLNGNRFIGFAPATPTTGEYARGDHVYFDEPSSGGILGTVCVAGGTPGTWKSFGPIMGDTTVTSNDPLLNLSQTWNAGGVAFTGLKFNVTDTASAATSKLLDLQVGGTSKWSVNKTGTMDLTVDNPIVIQRTGSNQGSANGITLKDQAGNSKGAIGLEGVSTNDLQLMGAAGIQLYTNSDLTSTNPRVVISTAGDASFTGLATFKSGTAPAAGGTQFVGCSSTAGLGFYFGTGDPTITAGKGSFYSRTDATTTTTRLWVNTDGGTTWTNLTTAA